MTTTTETPKLVRLTDERFSIGPYELKKGSIFAIYQSTAKTAMFDEKEVTFYSGFIPNAEHLRFFIRSDQIEVLTIDPAPYYNLAINMGYKGSPEYLAKDYNKILDLQYQKIRDMGNDISLNHTLEEAMVSFTLYDDYCKTELDCENYQHLRLLYLRIFEFLEKLQKVVDEYNTEQGL